MGKYAIFIVSALIFSLLTYSSALKNALFMSGTRIVESHGINQSYNIAQAAAMIVVKDLYDNNDDSSFYPEEDESYSYPSSTGFQNWPEMKGSYNILTSNQGDTLIIVQSTGRFDESNYRVAVGLIKSGGTTWMPPLDQAIYAKNSINLGNADVEGGGISINNVQSSFSAGPQASVEGDYSFYDPDLPPGEIEDDDGGGKGNDTIEGSTYNLSEEILFPDPVFPTFPAPSPYPETYSGSGTLFASDISGKYFSSFSSNNTTINISGHEEVILHVDNIDLSGGINVVGDGILKIYAETGLEIHGGDINADRPSKHLEIYYNGTSDINYNGKSTFSGLLFANSSETDIDIGGNPTFKGHIISFGKNVNFHGNESVSNLVYAPYAHVTISGTGSNPYFNGAIISEEFSANGQPIIKYNPDLEDELPELEGGGDPTFMVSYWN